MKKQKIAIACQGGGSQTAFTAGVLKALFDHGIHLEKRIVAITGTSGGALDAALAWYGLLKTSHGDKTPISKRISDFWQELSATHPMEIFLDSIVTDALRKATEGLLPTFEISPCSAEIQWMQSTLASLMPRQRFTDFKGLLEDHIKFDEIESLMKPDSPVLLIGAANVMKGNLKIFSSHKGEFSVEAILASAAIPSIFPAVKIGEDYYWDGLFSANPPVDELMQIRFMGMGNIPDEIWIILINPITCKRLPTKPNEIVDRRNEMIGNVSLLQDLETIEYLGRIFEVGGLTDEVLKRAGLTNKSWVKVRFIQMSEELQDSLDYPSKLSRNPDVIRNLMADGEKQVQAFLADLSKPAHTIQEAANKLRGIS